MNCRQDVYLYVHHFTYHWRSCWAPTTFHSQQQPMGCPCAPGSPDTFEKVSFFSKRPRPRIGCEQPYPPPCHRIHVWQIYLHLPYKINEFQVHIHIPYMDPMGFGLWGTDFFVWKFEMQQRVVGCGSWDYGEAKEIRPDMCRELRNSKSLWKDFKKVPFHNARNESVPRCSMYAIFAYIWLEFMVNLQ